MNELSTLLLDQPVFSQNGRKGISYDWQSLLVTATPNDAIPNDLAILRELDLELELATAASE
ncbi:MAG: hypothetical protein K8R99_11380 [Actinomycetia bacterium]|nr:hypothetical protein [Actinomycetes bacterium]